MTVLLDAEVIATGLGFPEGPVAMADGSVLVVDITNGRVVRVDAEGSVVVVGVTGGGPNGAAIGPDGALYICNNGGLSRRSLGRPALQRMDLTTGEVDDVYTGCDGKDFVALNDLVFDAAGCCWFTDFGGDAIYYAAPDGTSITRAPIHVHDPNGIGLSPAGDVLYWAETYTRQVHRRRLAGPGRVVESPRHSVPSLMRHQEPDPWTLVAGLPGRQELDSLAVEAGGAVCVGTLIDSGITVVDPATGAVEKYTLPAPCQDGAITNICFGGPDLRTAYITASITGRILKCRWPRPGLALAYQEVPADRP